MVINIIFISLLEECYIILWSFPVGTVVKNLPTEAEDTGQSLGWEDNPCTEESGGL